MSFTVIVTRNVEERVRGFLCSCMLEIASGVYTASVMAPPVRERIVAVLEKWRVGHRGDSAVITWADAQSPGGQGLLILGEPPLALADAGNIVLGRRPLSEAELRSLTIQLTEPPF